nr:hypothetical protein CFP56_21297 [Quercus suber]
MNGSCSRRQRRAWITRGLSSIHGMAHDSPCHSLILDSGSPAGCPGLPGVSSSRQRDVGAKLCIDVKPGKLRCFHHSWRGGIDSEHFRAEPTRCYSRTLPLSRIFRAISEKLCLGSRRGGLTLRASSRASAIHASVISALRLSFARANRLTR